jgi:hypothetical protein
LARDHRIDSESWIDPSAKRSSIREPRSQHVNSISFVCLQIVDLIDAEALNSRTTHKPSDMRRCLVA